MNEQLYTSPRALLSRRGIKNFIAACSNRPAPALPLALLVADFALWLRGLVAFAGSLYDFDRGAWTRIEEPRS